MNRLLHTQGQGYFEESQYPEPQFDADTILVKNIMTGICTSDVAMMMGEFGPLPLHMQGHEGLAQVISVGSNVNQTVKVGDYVATRGEPAYADRYAVKQGQFVVVPEAHPKYIIEPVACGINIVESEFMEVKGRSITLKNPKLLIIGSGFLAYVVYKTLRLNNTAYQIDVVGSSNQEAWQQENVTLRDQPDSHYEVVIVLKEGIDFLARPEIINENGLLIDAVGRSISKRESENLLWRAVTTSRPSPRKPRFDLCMEQAVEWIQNGDLHVDRFWTRAYNRDTEWRQAFQDSANRPLNYSRGYIVWQ